MGRDYKETPCPECGSKNVEQRKMMENQRLGFRLYLDCKCFHCGHKWEG